jgi:hypothetical protein
VPRGVDLRYVKRYTSELVTRWIGLVRQPIGRCESPALMGRPVGNTPVFAARLTGLKAIYFRLNNERDVSASKTFFVTGRRLFGWLWKWCSFRRSTYYRLAKLPAVTCRPLNSSNRAHFANAHAGDSYARPRENGTQIAFGQCCSIAPQGCAFVLTPRPAARISHSKTLAWQRPDALSQQISTCRPTRETDNSFRRWKPAVSVTVRVAIRPDPLYEPSTKRF